MEVKAQICYGDLVMFWGSIAASESDAEDEGERALGRPPTVLLSPGLLARCMVGSVSFSVGGKIHPAVCSQPPGASRAVQGPSGNGVAFHAMALFPNGVVSAWRTPRPSGSVSVQTHSAHRPSHPTRLPYVPMLAPERVLLL